jgi:hypothetical protein
MSQEKQHTSPAGASPLGKDPIFPIWKLEEQVREQLRRGVRTLSGAVVAASIGSSMFTYVSKTGDKLLVKYVDGCVVITAYAILMGEEVKVNNVTVHNICSRVDI